MKRSYAALVVAASAAFAAGHALAADASVNPAQVQAELAAARLSGDLVDGSTGNKLNQLFPGRYAAQDQAQGASRDQVQAELSEAQRNGDTVDGSTGAKLNELFPGRYAAKAQALGKTRAQVKAELFDAIRAGQAPVYTRT